ncbi:type II secretion system protein GspD [Deinococcus ruber]|uniref:Uncharacterized protein n=1 Tax=Deinococcus ruber TaxID=1848197 RepID=A0A918CKU6_9DEIO|nr:secretin N-terminal domain-containing protein [Deinococcus ruber]GGR30559.1 hypothetical protein GCM10008957_46620 [Deinococcus ruber]
MNKSLLALSLTLLLAVPASALGATATASRLPSLAVQLTGNPRLDKPLTVVLPAGAPLSTVLNVIARASGLTLLARDIPPFQVNTNFKGLTARAALEQLLSLYQDAIKGQLIGNTLVVAPAIYVDRLNVVPGSARSVVPVTINDDDARRLSGLTGAQVLPINGTTIVSGSPAQIQDVQKLLLGMSKPLPAAAKIPTKVSADVQIGDVDPALAQKAIDELYGVTITVAYGRAYLQSDNPDKIQKALTTLKQLASDAQAAHDAEVAAQEAAQKAAAQQKADQDAAQQKLNDQEAAQKAAQVAAQQATAQQEAAQKAAAAPVPTPAPPPPLSLEQRTVSTTLSADLLTRLATVSGAVKLNPLDAGTYVVQGNKDDLALFTQALQAAEIREATRISVTYPRVPATAIDSLKEVVSTVSARIVPGGLEVRGTPQEQVRVSMYLASVVQALPPAPPAPAAPAAPVEPITVRVPLSYALPSVIAAELTTLYSSGSAAAAVTPATTSATPATPTTTEAATPAPAATTPTSAATPAATSDVRIVPDERSRSIVLSGPSATVARMQRTIADLDTRLSDVRMALKVEQISGSTGQDLGVDWSVGLGGFSIAQSAGSLSAGYKPGVGALSLSATLNAARSEGRANTLLDTTFAAQDGRSANFKNGGQILLPSSTTTSGGTTSTSRTSYDYGLDVTLVPRLAPDGRIELTVELQLGEQPVSGVADSVIIAKRSMTTVVTVTPGEPLILGGVLSQDTAQNSKGVPLLSQIPVIGGLFGKSSNTASSSVLLITLQAADRTDDRAPTPPQLGDGVTRVTIPGK